MLSCVFCINAEPRRHQFGVERIGVFLTITRLARVNSMSGVFGQAAVEQLAMVEQVLDHVEACSTQARTLDSAVSAACAPSRRRRKRSA